MIPAQALSDFLCAIVYAYRNSFLSLMRDIQDVHIRVMLFSYLSCQSVPPEINAKAAHFERLHDFAVFLFNFRILILAHLTLSFLVFLAFLAFFYYILIKSFRKLVPSLPVLPAICALTCGILPR